VVCQINEQSIDNLFLFCKKQIKKENYLIQIEAIKLCVKLMKYAKENSREEILKYVNFEFLENNNFYYRRLYFSFIEECIDNFSICYLKEKGLILNLIKFLSLKEGCNKNLIGKTLKFFQQCFPLFHNDDKLVFLSYNKLELLRKTTLDREIINV
jgi:hypothetical protein